MGLLRPNDHEDDESTPLLSSSSSSESKKFLEGRLGRKVSCEGDGDNFGVPQFLPKTWCCCASGAISGLSRAFRVVDGRVSIMVPVLELLLLSLPFCGPSRFVPGRCFRSSMKSPSSLSDSVRAELGGSSSVSLSSSNPESLQSTAMHCSTFSANRRCFCVWPSGGEMSADVVVRLLK